MNPSEQAVFKIDYISIAKKIILKYIDVSVYKIFVYGSRARDTHYQFSDLDIGIIGDKPLPAAIQLELEHELNESRIPFKVDVVDFFLADENFKNHAMQKVIWWSYL